MTLALALEIDGDGAHPEAGRGAAHPADPRRAARVAALAENAGFTLVTLDDDLTRPGRIGAVERAAFIAESTSVLGVAPVISTTYTEPFHVSSQLATLDHVSAGRAGWVVATSPSAEAARAWGRPRVEGEAALEREARDSVTVVGDLWDSWEDDAVVRDVATSRYLDRDRLHYVDFTGETFAVKGPAIVPRPPQGRLVVLAPPALGPADVALVTDPAETADAPRRFLELEVALDAPGASGEERIADLGGWPATGRPRHVGSAAGLVALLGRLDRVVDGVRIHPLVLDTDLAVLSRFVVPALLRGRVAARPLPGVHLRSTLGLPRPANRFSEAPA